MALDVEEVVQTGVHAESKSGLPNTEIISPTIAFVHNLAQTTDEVGHEIITDIGKGNKIQSEEAIKDFVRLRGLGDKFIGLTRRFRNVLNPSNVTTKNDEDTVPQRPKTVREEYLDSVHQAQE